MDLIQQANNMLDQLKQECLPQNGEQAKKTLDLGAGSSLAINTRMGLIDGEIPYQYHIHFPRVSHYDVDRDIAILALLGLLKNTDVRKSLELCNHVRIIRDGAQKHLAHFLGRIDEDSIPTQTLQVGYEVIATYGALHRDTLDSYYKEVLRACYRELLQDDV